MARDIQRKRFLDRFSRRRANLLKRADLLRADFGAQVYVVVYAHGKYCTYRSNMEESWPPPPEKLVL